MATTKTMKITKKRRKRWEKRRKEKWKITKEKMHAIMFISIVFRSIWEFFLFSLQAKNRAQIKQNEGEVRSNKLFTFFLSSPHIFLLAFMLICAAFKSFKIKNQRFLYHKRNEILSIYMRIREYENIINTDEKGLFNGRTWIFFSCIAENWKINF